jgi:predicted secreted protein
LESYDKNGLNLASFLMKEVPMLSKTTFILFMVFTCSLARGGQHNKIDTLGFSRAGQFVAFEEYGYNTHNHSYFVSIKIMNVWTEEYVGASFEVEEPALGPDHLAFARLRAKKLAAEELKKFKISG